jgi:hypothetical protein
MFLSRIDYKLKLEFGPFASAIDSWKMLTSALKDLYIEILP